MSLAWKVTVTVVLFLVAAAAAIVLIVNLLGTPPTVDFTSASPGQAVNVTLQTVGSYGSGSHPTWVSYLVKSPDGQWVHTTNFQVPAARPHQRHDRPVRLGEPPAEPATRPGDGHVRQRGPPQRQAFRVIDSNSGNGVAHTFSMPSLGINVPLYGNNGNANLCAAAPCTTKSPHKVIKFSFTSPGRGTTAGSASSRAGWATSSATEGRCRPSATWAASCEVAA